MTACMLLMAQPMKKLATILIIMSTQAMAQDWVDNDLYPFEHYFLPIASGNIHYVDEGQGDVILFVHGTPTWSFLYREFIKPLSVNHRCIAPDHLGFGLSEAPDSFGGTPKLHAKNLIEFIEKLDLQNITLVVHDFGGPIGLAAAIELPGRIRNVVMFNTWLWGTKKNKDAQKINKIVNSSIGKFLYLTMNFSPKVLLKKGFNNKKHLSKTVHQQYIRPFPDKQSRKPLLHLAKSLVGSSDWYDLLWTQLDILEDKNWLILWGVKDTFITTAYLQKWKDRLPHKEVHELDCGHFVQEEKTEDAIYFISRFLLTQR